VMRKFVFNRPMTSLERVTVWIIEEFLDLFEFTETWRWELEWKCWWARVEKLASTYDYLNGSP